MHSSHVKAFAYETALTHQAHLMPAAYVNAESDINSSRVMHSGSFDSQVQHKAGRKNPIESITDVTAHQAFVD